jgi:hypothetical protein
MAAVTFFKLEMRVNRAKPLQHLVERGAVPDADAQADWVGVTRNLPSNNRFERSRVESRNKKGKK